MTDVKAAQASIESTEFRSPWKIITSLNRSQAITFTAAFFGWTLDAFDFFTVSLAAPRIAADFGIPLSQLTQSITVTLMLRPVGALIFGTLADRYGRTWPLMIDIVLYAVFELASGFAKNFTTFIILRGFFGVCMGGEWGLGASLAMESLPVEARGLFSGILQEGYAAGYLLATTLFYFVFTYTDYPSNWRLMFWIGCFPALPALFLRFFVHESDTFVKTQEQRKRKGRTFFEDLGAMFRKHWGICIYCILLMSAFNFMSHGSQDLYPSFLQKQLNYTVSQTTVTNVLANFGALIGGPTMGFLSQYFGRKRTIIACALLGGAMIALWSYGPNIASLQTGAFFLQFFVQGAWGIVPIHLNELSPPDFRGLFPGLMYQIGNLVSASSAQIEAVLGEHFPNSDGTPNYALAQACLMAIVFFVLIVLTAIGHDNRGRDFEDHLDDPEMVETVTDV